MKLLAAIPHSELIPRLPSLPFIGELSYADVARSLGRQIRWMSRPERILVGQLKEYLDMKLATRRRQNWPNA